MTMGQKMKQLRQENNLTMEELATELNKYGAKLSKSKISLLENDKVSLNNRYIDYYVKFFKISYDWLKGKNKCIGQKLMKLRLDNNLKLDELVKIFNEKYNSKIDITTISKLEQNKLSANNKYLGYYADYFGVSYEWLQNDEQARHIVKNATIQSLGLNTKSIPLYSKDELIKNVNDILVFGLLTDEMKRYYINLPKIDTTSLFAFTVYNDMGLPLIPKGSIVIVDSSIKLDKLGNNIGAFIYNDNIYIGQYLKKEDDTTILIPTNTLYNNILINNNYVFAYIGQIIKIILNFENKKS